MKIQYFLAIRWWFWRLCQRKQVLFLLLVCPFAAQAVTPLVMAFSELEPWKTSDAGRYGGAYTEIVRELGKRSGLPVEILPCPLKRCLLLMQEGKADVIIGVQASSQRKEFIHFLPTPYRKRSSDKVFYVSKGKAASIRQYQDLAQLRIGVKQGAEYFARFDHDASLKKNAILNNKGNFKKLLLGRLDAIIIAEDQGEALVSALGIRDQVEKAHYREPDPTPRTIGIAKKSVHAANLNQLDSAMKAMVKDGTLRMLFQRYYYEACKVPADAVVIE